jgi:hypothetical protein
LRIRDDDHGPVFFFCFLGGGGIVAVVVYRCRLSSDPWNILQLLLNSRMDRLDVLVDSHVDGCSFGSDC